jgi:hypothetical protein
VFAKGHVRAYARVVGLDPDDLVSEYLEQWPAATHELPIFRPPPREAHGVHRLVGPVLGLAALLFAYGVLREPGEPTALVPAVHPATFVAPPSIAREVADHPLPTAIPIDGGIRLEMQPTAECWVSAVADGELVIHRLLQKGERATVDAASEMVVRIGDPGAFAYTLNGVPGRALGDAGVPITVTITEQNYRAFLEETEPDTPPSSAATV